MLGFLNSRGIKLSRKPSLKDRTPSRLITRQNSGTSKTKIFQPNTQEMKRVFEKYDTNKDGKVSKEEYKAMLRAINGKGMIVNTEVEATKAFQVADKDGDGFIDFKEFMELHDNKVNVKDIESAFRVFDSDGDGKISANELMEVLLRMGERHSLHSCKKMICEVDKDGDGLINLNEFINMMTRSMNSA